VVVVVLFAHTKPMREDLRAPRGGGIVAFSFTGPMGLKSPS